MLLRFELFFIYLNILLEKNYTQIDFLNLKYLNKIAVEIKIIAKCFKLVTFILKYSI